MNNIIPLPNPLIQIISNYLLPSNTKLVLLDLINQELAKSLEYYMYNYMFAEFDILFDLVPDESLSIVTSLVDFIVLSNIIIPDVFVCKIYPVLYNSIEFKTVVVVNNIETTYIHKKICDVCKMADRDKLSTILEFCAGGYHNGLSKDHIENECCNYQKYELYFPLDVALILINRNDIDSFKFYIDYQCMSITTREELLEEIEEHLTLDKQYKKIFTSLK